VRCREAVALVRAKHAYSERRICRALGIARSVVRYVPQPRADEAPLRQSIIALAAQYGRYGYRQVAGLLWQEGLKVPQKQPQRAWLGRLGTKTLYIQPGSPWGNGDWESFNAKLRNELLNGELFYTLRGAQVLIEQWRCHYNRVRPYSALGYRPPALGSSQ